MAKGNGRSGDKRSPAKVMADNAKAGRAVELKNRGWTYDQIAKELGWAGRQGAGRAVKSALARHFAATVGAPSERYVRRELRRCEEEFARLDEILKGVAKDAKAIAVGEDGIKFEGGAFDGNIEAAEVALKVSAERRKWAEHRAKLLGLLKNTEPVKPPLVINVTAEVAQAFAPPLEEVRALPQGDGAAH